MPSEHHARITWSEQQVGLGLPAIAQMTDPSFFTEPGSASEEGWSLICRFDSPPSSQGNPSLATIQFLVNEAPEHRLKPGVTLMLFERGTGKYAVVEILE